MPLTSPQHFHAPGAPSAKLQAAAAAIALGANVCRWVQPRLIAGAASQPDPAAFSTANWQIRKTDASPVTVADLACQAVVNTQLLAAGLITGPASPNAPGMLAEEAGSTLTGDASAEIMQGVLSVLRGSGAAIDARAEAVLEAIDAARLTAYSKAAPLPERYWTLDPIDGTKGFIKGRGYAVCLALVERGQPTLCALACPKLSCDPATDPLAQHEMGCLVLAERLGPPTSPPAWGPVWSVPLMADGAPDWKAAIAGGPPPHPAANSPPASPRWTEGLERSPRDVRVLDQVLLAVGGQRTIAMDSQAKYATVARNQADIYLRPAPRSWGMHVWDHAAGVGLCQAAGRLTTDLRGSPIEFSTGYALSGQGILVAPPHLQPQILAALQRIPDAFATADWIP